MAVSTSREQDPGSGARAARTAHRDAEADVGSTYVCYQSQHRGAVKLISIRIRAGKRVIDRHHLAPKNRKSWATVDSAVNQMAAGFYLLIKVSVARPVNRMTPFDNAV